MDASTINSKPKLATLSGGDDDLAWLLAACQSNCVGFVRDAIRIYPDLAWSKNTEGQSTIRIACENGNVEILEALIESNPPLAFSHSTEQALNCKQEKFLHTKDYDGDDVFHIASPRRSNAVLKLWYRNCLADSNSSNSGDFMALDIPNDRPQSGKIDREIDTMLREAGAVRSRDLTNQRVKPGDDYFDRGEFWSSDLRTSSSMIGSRSALLLLIATLLAAITYQVPFRLLGNTSREGRAHNSIIGVNEQDSIMSSSFVLFNSIVFVASVVMTIFLQHELPMKPLPQLSVSALFGSYMYLMKATSPNEALALLLISVPFLLLAAAGKFHWLSNQSIM